MNDTTADLGSLTRPRRRHVLVIGAAGNFGGAIAPALVRAGHHVRALRRANGRPLRLRGVQVVPGDALVLEDVRRAARGVDTIVHAFNVPYPRWDPVLFDAARIVAEVAADERARIVLPGNVYGLDPRDGRPLAEDAARASLARKSAIRNRLEDQLAAAAGRGAKLLIVRAGDYFGPGATLTWFHEMTKKAAARGALSDPGRPGVVHDWAYLPDLAAATVALVERQDELRNVETFNFSSYQLSTRELLDAVNAQLANPLPIRRLPWWLMRPAGLFAPMLRELVDLKYLWDRPLRLDDGKLRRFLGETARTPLCEALDATLGCGSTHPCDGSMPQNPRHAFVPH